MCPFEKIIFGRTFTNSFCPSPLGEILAEEFIKVVEGTSKYATTYVSKSAASKRK